MDLVELYENIENPLNDESTFMTIIEDYTKLEQGLGGFYEKLTTNVEKQNPRKYLKKDGDLFSSTMFHLWKKSILEMKKETFLELRDKGYLQDDFVLFRKYLRTVPDLSTEQEINQFFYNNSKYGNEISKYRWNNFSQDPTWQHVSSRHVNSYQEEKINVEHRLYLNMELADIYKTATLFVNKCNDKNIPYYFKFDRMGTRDDSMVLYSDTKHLKDYLEILGEIKKEHPDLVSRFYNPPILTGKIDDYIGYGSEPTTERTSYTSKRAKMIENTLDTETRKWIVQNRQRPLRYQGRFISFEEYFSKKVVGIFLEKLEKDLNYQTSFSNEFEATTKLGYSLNDIHTQSMRLSLERITQHRIKQGLSNYCIGKGFDDIKIEVRNGKTIKLTSDTLDKTMRKLSIQIAQHDKNYIKLIKHKIQEESQNQDIDPKTFCFDISIKEKMLGQKDKKSMNSQEELNRMLQETTSNSTKNNMHK